MKNLALAVVLFCGLSAVLGYVATSGLAVRAAPYTPSVPPELAEEKPAKPTPPAVVVKAQRLPVASKAPSKPVAAKPKTHLRVVQVARPLKPEPTQVKVSVPETRPKALVALHKPSERSVVVERPRRPEPVVDTRPQPQPRVAERPDELPTDREALQREIEENRKWRKSTFERWERDEAERKRRERDAIKNEFDESGRLRPADQVEKEMEPADKVDSLDKKKKKRKRHRFLMFKW